MFDGGIVDGETVGWAEEIGLDIGEELRKHNSSPALHKLRDGIMATRNISMNDLSVTLVLGCS